MSFEKAVEKVLENEGGYVNRPEDPGGETNFGISKRWADKIRIHLDIPNLTKEKATELYREYFWDAYGFERIDAILVSSKLFDTLINVGPSQAFKFLQRALRCNGYKNVQDDGVLGPITLRALNVSIPALIIPSFCSEQAGFYRLLVALEPRKKYFLNGWLKRAYDE